jgi:hypothetical protein
LRCSARRTARGVPRPDLQWDDRLARHAKTWAEHLIRHGGALKHADNRQTGEGENLYWYWNSDRSHESSFKGAVESWNEERTLYRGQRIGEPGWSDWGHYTQVGGFQFYPFPVLL